MRVLLVLLFCSSLIECKRHIKPPCINRTLACPLFGKGDELSAIERVNRAIGELLPDGRLEETLSCLLDALKELNEVDNLEDLGISDGVFDVINGNVDILCASLVPFNGVNRRLFHNINEEPLKWPPLTGPLPPPPAKDKAIFVKDDLLTPAQCSALIDLFERSALHEGNLLSGGKIIIDRKGKNRWEFDMSVSSSDYPDTWGVWDRLFVGVVVKELLAYEAINPIMKTLKTPLGDEGFRMIRYQANSSSTEPEQHMWHADGGQEAKGANPRLLASIIYLNSPLEGGETVFLNQGITVTPKCGRGLLFPSAFPYVHGGRPVRQGSKYAMVLMITL